MRGSASENHRKKARKKMKIELLNLSCENFKGLKKFSVNFDGADATITAANGVGKTTVYDSFLYLLFGKDSTGRKEFELRPLQDPTVLGNLGTRPIKGLVLSVQAGVCIDGAEHAFRKEHHEKVVKGQLRGYETLCWIDEVPKKISEYQAYIESIIPEETFKMLTDLSHFNGKLHWSDRRRVLLAIAGDVGTPAGFEALMAALNGRDIDEFKKVLTEQKKRHEKERNEINPRIDEIHKGMEGYVAEDTDMLQGQRTGVEQTIEALNVERARLLNDEKRRQARIDGLNKLTCQRLQRETELKHDTSGTKALQDEKAAIEAAYCEQEAALAKLYGKVNLNQAAFKGAESGLAELMLTLKNVRSEYERESEEPPQDICSTCKQTLPKDMVADNETRRKENLATIAERGTDIKRDVDAYRARIEAYQRNSLLLTTAREKAEHELRDKETANKARITEIDKLIAGNPKTQPEDDGQWQDFTAEIEKLQAEIGEPASAQLETIETNRKAAQEVLNKLNETLAQADRIEADRQRIAELEAREKELAQLVADLDKQLSEIGEYKAEMSRRIESAVNGRFKYVEFKMFNELLNGELVDCCEATYCGVPYQGTSAGEQIIAGVDIVNVLSGHYGVSVPLFVDHAESLTLPLEAKSQTIELYAADGIDELQVEVKERTAAA